MGWVFPDSDTEVLGADPDHLNGAKSVRELYDIASSNYTGKYTVPVSSLNPQWGLTLSLVLLLHLTFFGFLVSLFVVGSLG